MVVAWPCLCFLILSTDLLRSTVTEVFGSSPPHRWFSGFVVCLIPAFLCFFMFLVWALVLLIRLVVVVALCQSFGVVHRFSYVFFVSVLYGSILLCDLFHVLRLCCLFRDWVDTSMTPFAVVRFRQLERVRLCVFGLVFLCFLSFCRLLVLFVSVGSSSVLSICVVSNCLFVVLWLCVRVVFYQGTRVEAVLGLPQAFGGSLLCTLICFVCVCPVVFVF